MITIGSVSEIGITSSSHILVVMPHPDDETAFASGFIHQAASLGATVHLLCMTSGEASTLRFGLSAGDNLGRVREIELANAVNILGVKGLQFGHLPDGGISKHKPQTKKIILDKISTFSPDLVLTLEPDGIYGHPDHIALTEAVTSINFPNTIFATVDNNFKVSKGAAAMAMRPIRPLAPTHKLILSKQDQDLKLNCFRCHKSQFRVIPKFIAKWLGRHLLQSEFFVIKS